MFLSVNKSYDLLRREGLLRLNRKSGGVVQRDAGSGPAEPGLGRRLAEAEGDAPGHRTAIEGRP